jgi:hypothetical protein
MVTRAGVTRNMVATTDPEVKSPDWTYPVPTQQPKLNNRRTMGQRPGSMTGICSQMRGDMPFRKVWERLNALPEEEKVLAFGVYIFWNNGKKECGCVLGKALRTIYERGQFFYPASRVLSANIFSVAGILDPQSWETSHWLDFQPQEVEAFHAKLRLELKELDIDIVEAGRLQNYNDTCIPTSEEASNTLENRKKRFQRVMDWMALNEVEDGRPDPRVKE